MSKQQNKIKDGYSTLDKNMGIGKQVTKPTIVKKLDPNKKIAKSFKLGEDVVDFLDRLNFHKKINRTSFLELLVRQQFSNPDFADLPPMPADRKAEEERNLKALVGVK